MTHEVERHLILGAAGHVDHGKTALMTALTGVNTDRLKEEQERGISIELGFAELDLGDGTVLGVVDMPGHEKFVRQMVAGAGGVDLAILVVAADESVMPQTVEHLEILDSLDVAGGVVALTKIDLVDEELVEIAEEEVRDLVAGTFLAGRPICRVSALRRLGLEELLEALRREARAVAPAGSGPFRLPVDRVFSLPGAGTIVTGTCWSGEARTGDRLVLEPGGMKVRVREVQAHGRAVPVGGAGQRLALALHGVKKDELERGCQVTAPGACEVVRRLDLRVDLLPSYHGRLKNRQRLHVHHAGREVLGRIVLLDEDELGDETGRRTGLAQLHLEDALVARPGDRLILRFYSPVTSIAGGTVLDVVPQRHKRFDEESLTALAVREAGDEAEVLRQRLLEAGVEGLAASEAAGGADDQTVVRVGERLYHRDVLDRLASAVAGAVAAYAERFPLRLGIPKEEARRRLKFKGGPSEWTQLLEAMAPRAEWCVRGDRIAAGPDGPPLGGAVAAAVSRRETLLRGYGLAWPGQAQLAADAGDAAGQPEEEFLRHLVDRGRAVQVAPDYHVHAEALAEAVSRLREHFRGSPEITFGGFRELTGLSRKLGIPLLEFLDQTGVTERVGDNRRAGPALGKDD